MTNKALREVSLPLNAEIKLYTPRVCIAAIIAAHNSACGLNDGFNERDDKEAVIADALSSEDYDYCIAHAGFSESTMREYQAFKEEFLNTDWCEFWDMHWWDGKDK